MLKTHEIKTNRPLPCAGCLTTQTKMWNTTLGLPLCDTCAQTKKIKEIMKYGQYFKKTNISFSKVRDMTGKWLHIPISSMDTSDLVTTTKNWLLKLTNAINELEKRNVLDSLSKNKSKWGVLKKDSKITFNYLGD